MSYKLINSGDKHIALKFTKEDMSAALKYWTKERMSTATPEPCISEAPEDPSEITHQKTSTDLLDVNIADIDTNPFNAGGKIFYTKNGKDFVASAEFCGDKQLILSAAHCFYDKESGAYATNIIFYRCYDDRKYEQKTAVSSVVIESKYVSISSSEYYCYDYGFGITEDESTVEVLGYQKDVTSGSVIAFGYPTNYYDGKTMVYVEGEIYPYGNRLKMPGNGMGKGCSGGAWVLSGTNNAVSVNSTSPSGDNTEERGPKFSNDFEELLIYAKTFIVPVSAIRYFHLHNGAAVVARMQILWELGEESGIYEEDGYHDVCAGAERIVDMRGTNIPEGATVRLKASVPMGDDAEAEETFIYNPNASKMSYYKLSGSAFKTWLRFLEIK